MKNSAVLSLVAAVIVCLACATVPPSEPVAQICAVQAPEISDLIKAQKEQIEETITYVDENLADLTGFMLLLVEYQQTQPTIAWAGQIPGWIALYEETIEIFQAQRAALTGFLLRTDLVPDEEIGAALKSKITAGFQERAELVAQQMRKDEVLRELKKFIEQRQ